MASSQFPFCDHHPQKSVRHCNGSAILTTEKEPGVVCQTRLAWICKGCFHGSCQDSKTQVPSIISQAITLDSNLYLSLMSVLIWINGYLSPYLQGSHVTLPSNALISPEKSYSMFQRCSYPRYTYTPCHYPLVASHIRCGLKGWIWSVSNVRCFKLNGIKRPKLVCTHLNMEKEAVSFS